MTTLKQLLSDPCKQIKHDCVDNCGECLAEIVREWLLQKRQEPSGVFGEYFGQKAKNSLIDELLEELK